MKKTKIEKQPLPEGTHSAPSSDGDNIKNSLRRKIFRMNILLVAAAVILFAIAGILQMNRFARLMEDTSLEENTVIMETTSESMREMATESFQKYVVAQAKVVDGEFWTMRHDLEILARQVQMVLEYPDAFSPLEVPLPSEADAGKLSLQLLYSENADREDPALKEQILRIGGLRNMILEIVEGGDTLMDCMVSLPGGASIIADRTPESKMNEDGKILPYNADRRPWYVGALVHEETYFTPVNMDNYFTNYEVMAGVPVYAGFAAGVGKLFGITGGFLLSFPIMSWLAGKGEEKKSMPWLIASLVLGAVLNYIIGMCWFVFVAESNFAAAFTACVLPFIPTAIIKVLMAAFIGKELRSALVKAQVLKAA